MKKLVTALGALLIGATLFSTNVYAQDTDAYTDTARNKFSAGTNATISDENVLDAFVAGSGANVQNTEAAGNLFMAGNMVTLKDSNCGATVFIAGNQIGMAQTDINGNIFAAGNIVTINDVNAAGIYGAASEISVEGGSYSYANLSGETVNFNAIVDGDVLIEATNVHISDDAVITGTLTVKSPEDTSAESDAKVGTYVYEKLADDTTDAANAAKESIGSKIFHKCTSRLYWIVALGIVGLLLCLFFGQALDEAKTMIQFRTAPMIASGLITLFLTPLALVLVACTFIGLPLAGFVLIAYVGIIAIGSTFAGASLGRLAFPTLNKYLASFIGICILTIVDIIPFIGVIVSLAADGYLCGYLTQKIYLNVNNTKAAKDVVPAAEISVADDVAAEEVTPAGDDATTGDDTTTEQ